jgi:hypothetical protein
MATDPREAPPAARAALAALRRHPVITALMIGCTLAGAVLGALYLSEDWSLLRRVAAGGVAGGGIGLLLTGTKLVGQG